MTSNGSLSSLPFCDYEEFFQRDLARFSHASDYTMRYTVQHLLSAGHEEKVYRLLVGNRAWMLAKFERIGMHRDYDNELQR